MHDPQLLLSGDYLVTIRDIRTDAGTQVRLGLDEPTIVRYAALYKTGEELPVLSVVHDAEAGELYLVDGFHRLEAMLRAGYSLSARIRVRLDEGDLDSARWRACKANRCHGLQLTDADADQALQMALRTRRGRSLPLGDVERAVGCRPRGKPEDASRALLDAAKRLSGASWERLRLELDAFFQDQFAETNIRVR